MNDVSILSDGPFVTNVDRYTAEEAQKSEGKASHERRRSFKLFAPASDLAPQPTAAAPIQTQPLFSNAKDKDDINLLLTDNTT